MQFPLFGQINVTILQSAERSRIKHVATAFSDVRMFTLASVIVTGTIQYK